MYLLHEYKLLYYSPTLTLGLIKELQFSTEPKSQSELELLVGTNCIEFSIQHFSQSCKEIRSALVSCFRGDVIVV